MHTPGPWKVDHNGVITGGDKFLTSICETKFIKWQNAAEQADTYNTADGAAFWDLVEHAKGNGRLIAAAPELLGALKHAVEVFSDLHYNSPDKTVYLEVMQPMRDAIDKAS